MEIDDEYGNAPAKRLRMAADATMTDGSHPSTANADLKEEARMQEAAPPQEFQPQPLPQAQLQQAASQLRTFCQRLNLDAKSQELSWQLMHSFYQRFHDTERVKSALAFILLLRLYSLIFMPALVSGL